jgi:hypothetical protein
MGGDECVCVLFLFHKGNSKLIVKSSYYAHHPTSPVDHF